MLAAQSHSDLESSQLKSTIEAGTTLALIYFFLVGASPELASSSFINAIDYFESEFPNAGLSFLISGPYLLGRLLGCVLMPKISNKFSYRSRMAVSMIVTAVLVAIAPFGAKLFHNSRLGVVMLLVLVFVTGFCGSVIDMSLGGITNQLESKFIISFQIGNGISGLITTAINALIIVIFNPVNNDELLSPAVFLLIVAGLIVICLILHLIFVKSAFYRSRWRSLPTDSQLLNEESFLQREPETAQPPQKRDWKSIIDITKLNWVLLVYLFISIAQMAVCYPGLMFLKPVNGISSDMKTVTMMAAFHSTIIIGKILTRFRKYYKNPTILVMVIIKFALVAFFIIQAETVEIPVFNTAWFGYLNIIVFGFMSGFASCAAFLLAAEQAGAENKEASGFVSIGTMTVGAAIGDGVALIFRGLKPPQ